VSFVLESAAQSNEVSFFFFWLRFLCHDDENGKWKMDHQLECMHIVNFSAAALQGPKPCSKVSFTLFLAAASTKLA